VLLVEDNAADASLLHRYLTRGDAAYDLTTATTGQDGLDQVRSLQPDVVLLDYELPDLNGLEFLDALQHMPDIAQPVVLAITGQADPRIAAELIRRGALDYLSKTDLSEDVVRLAVRQALRTRTLRDDLERRTREREVSRAELVASLERASYLTGVSELLTRSLDLKSVLDTVALLAIPYLADVCLVDVFEHGVLTRRAVELSEPLRARVPGELPRHAPSLEASEGVGRAIRSVQPVSYGRSWLTAVARWDADIAALLSAQAIDSLIVVPLLFDDKPLGAISFAAAQPHCPHAQSVAEEVARRASAAIANARAFEAQRVAMRISEAARRRLNTVSQVSAVFARSLDWRETMTALADALVPAFCDHATVVVIDDGQARIVASRSQAAPVQAAVARFTAAFPPGRFSAAGIGAVVQTGTPQFYADGDDSSAASADPQLAQLVGSLGFSAYLSVPIASTNGAVLGAMSLGGTGTRRFTFDDLAVAEDLGRRTGMYLTNARLFEREREIARALQTSLLPAEIPAVEGVEFAAQVIAGAEGVEVGGDWYDVVPLRGGKVAFAIGDVAGRGVLAAATMGQLRSSLRAYALEGLEPSDALARLNAFVLSQERMQFATVGLGVLDTASGVLRFASAGHLPPLLIEADGRPSLLHTASSLPVGLIADEFYEQSEHQLAPGDVLTLYTDGLVESRTRGIDEGLSAMLALAADETGAPEALVAKFLGRLGGDAGDDVTVLALRFAAGRTGDGRADSLPALGVTFPAIPSSSPTVRHRLAAYLAQLGFDPTRLDDALLAAGEAIANAIEHAYAGSREHGLFSLRAFVSNTVRVVIEVLDHGVWRQRGIEPTAALLAERGRGLTIMHALSDDVTVEHDDTGTRVRLVFAYAPAAAVAAGLPA
jgi:serine phosphatase RsbU (regulator of sigma subunit)/CheY-like chemotaxis protein/anti-sigma regulatory factor (Ser/Thr protein kinase)